MGLDMYLCSECDGEDDELGYWRKHPNLHGYIVQNFANGVDECQRIDLTEKDLDKILHATMDDALPTTTGFFFGKSHPDDKSYTIAIMKGAISWMRQNPDGKVYYQASW